MAKYDSQEACRNLYGLITWRGEMQPEYRIFPVDALIYLLLWMRIIKQENYD